MDKIMAAIQVKKEHLPTEWKPSVSGDESDFKVALNNAPINKSTIDELKQVLRLVMLKVGLRAANLPNDEEKQVLLEHIIREYGNHTPEEIKLAFDMALAFKLDLEEREISCYENFTCLYFSKIMNAYRKWARLTYRELKKEPMLLEEKKHLTDEEWEEWLSDMKGYTLEMIPASAYEYLLRVGKINPTVKQKKESWVSAETKYAVRFQDDLRKWNEFIGEKQKGEYGKENYSNLVILSKKIIVHKYLNNV